MGNSWSALNRVQPPPSPKTPLQTLELSSNDTAHAVSSAVSPNLSSTDVSIDEDQIQYTHQRGYWKSLEFLLKYRSTLLTFASHKQAAGCLPPPSPVVPALVVSQRWREETTSQIILTAISLFIGWPHGPPLRSGTQQQQRWQQQWLWQHNLIIIILW